MTKKSRQKFKYLEKKRRDFIEANEIIIEEIDESLTLIDNCLHTDKKNLTTLTLTVTYVNICDKRRLMVSYLP